MIVILGGRVVPAFTTNALRRAGETLFPASRRLVEITAVLSVALLALVEIGDDVAAVAGPLVALAALVNAVSLAGGRSHKTLDQPILWIIHLAYARLVAGLAFKAMAHFDLLPEGTALHVLTVGAVGSMTLGIMTRAGLGHTGRALWVSAPVTAAFLLVSLADAVRVAVPAVAPQYYNEGMLAAGIAWILAFGMVSAVYWPILTTPRQRAEPAGD